MFQIPYSSASPGNYVVSTFGFCLLIRIDVTFYLGNEIVVQMLRRAPVYWPRSEHLICIELFRLPTSVHMLMFISEAVINLAKIALSTVFYFSICFCKPVQYPVQSWRSTQLHNDMLEFAVLHNLHSCTTPLPYTESKKTLKFLPITKRIR